MLDQLMDSLKGEVISNITSKAGISADQAQNILPIASETLQSGLLKEVTGGNMAGILGMFNSGSGLADNPIFSSLKGMFLKNIMAKAGLPESVAGLVAGSGMESIIGGLAGKLGGSGAVSEDSIMSNLGLGGGGGGIADMAKNMALGAAKDKLKDLTGGLF